MKTYIGGRSIYWILLFILFLTVPLIQGRHSEIYASTSTFVVSDAHCFDPNEESKLRIVIEARGAELFNSRIRCLGRACSDRNLVVKLETGQTAPALASVIPGAVPEWPLLELHLHA